MLPIPARLHEPLRAALRGEAFSWPSDLTENELRALGQHGVTPLVYEAARVPQLRTEAIRAAAMEPLRADDIQTVLGALAARGIEPLLLKGTALAYDVYSAPELRPRGDTDLLIRHRDLAATREVMRALGFEERLTSGDEHGVRQVTFGRAGAFGIEHAYDVHWEVTNPALFASLMQHDALRARAIPIPRLGPHALGLCDTDALLLACIHRVAHHHDSERLIWLVDVALLRGRMPREAHERFWRAAAEARVVAVCRRAIALADEWLGREPRHGAEEWLSAQELERDEPSRAFLDREITQGGVMLANLRALPWRARAERLWQLAFPPAAFMQQSFGARSRFTLPWLYLYRAARGVARLFRRVGA